MGGARHSGIIYRIINISATDQPNWFDSLDNFAGVSGLIGWDLSSSYSCVCPPATWRVGSREVCLVSLTYPVVLFLTIDLHCSGRDEIMCLLLLDILIPICLPIPYTLFLPRTFSPSFPQKRPPHSTPEDNIGLQSGKKCMSILCREFQ